MTGTLDRREQAAAAGAVLQQWVGSALVLHLDDPISDEARSLALRIPPDPDNDIVVLDLPAGVPFAIWHALVRTWPRRRRRGVRLVAHRAGQGVAGLAAQWLSQRLRCTVYAPDGDLTVDASGIVLVHSSPESGWLKFRPGKPPSWSAKRYPAPIWDAAAAETRELSPASTAEPLPGGLWIRGTDDRALLDRHRPLVANASPGHRDAMTVVLGCPGAAPISLDDVRRWWDDQSGDIPARLRFVHFGPVSTPDGDRVGQALADALDANVVCYSGLPLTAPYPDATHTVLGDGRIGWPTFTRELGFAARVMPFSLPRRPVVLSHRLPLDLGEQIAERTYRVAADVLVEIVEAGLWVRGPQEPANAERVRAVPADPEHCAVVFDDGRSQSLRAVASRLAEQLNAIRVSSVVRAASDLIGATPEESILQPEPPAVQRWNGPTPPPVVLQPPPVPLEPAPVRESLGWLRRTLALIDPSCDVEALADETEGILAERPELRTAADPDDDLVAAMALRWHLTSGGAVVEQRLRTGQDGPHGKLAEVVAAALERLPRFVGPVAYARTPSSREWEIYQSRRVITDWGFVHALTRPCAEQPGDTNVLIWSMTAARTAVLEPADDARAEDRVLFRPGTLFKILELRLPEARLRGAILLREVSVDEIERDGTIDPRPVSRDGEAVTALLGQNREWARSEPHRRVGAGAASRFDRLPGLI